APGSSRWLNPSAICFNPSHQHSARAMPCRALCFLWCALAVLIIAAPSPAFDAREFWREPVGLPFNLTVLKGGVDGAVMWHAIVYTSEIYRDEPMRIFAYYARPRAAGKYPAVVSIHGGGGGADLSRAIAFAKAGYACLSFDWNTFGDPQAALPPRGVLPSKPYTVYGSLHYDESGRTWDEWGRQFFQPHPDWKGPILYRAVMAGRRALTWLSGRSEVDGQRLAVEGHSWGGFLTQLLTGLDSRVKAAVSTAAAGAWSSRYREGLAMHLQELSPADMAEWTLRYDPAFYAKDIKAPILIGLATADFFGSVDTLAEYWPSITAPKSLALSPGNNHGAFGDMATRVAWFNHWLKNGPAFPAVKEVTLSSVGLNEWQVRVRGGNAARINKGSVAWTTARGAWNRRAWGQRPLIRSAKDGASWSATFKPVQAGGPLRVFVSLRDANGRIASSLPIVQPLPAPQGSLPMPLANATLPIARTTISPLEAPHAWEQAYSLGPLASGPEALGEQSAHLDALWDDEALYLRVRVDDPTAWLPSPTGALWWQHDSVHVRLRTETQAGEAAVPDAAQHVFYLAWFPDPRSRAVRFSAVRGRGYKEAVADVSPMTGSVKVLPGAGYVLISRVPWAFIDKSFVPRPRRTIRFALQIVNGDVLTDEGAGGVDFNRGSDPGNPDAWGLARLVGE
ncbi:MAG TPA: alpha/beta fold hydrolase, partial [Abditibacteriaceae bacterium]|nr:alpha/beta fold hydrolase [Abditibacteriaceae bacterium]